MRAAILMLEEQHASFRTVKQEICTRFLEIKAFEEYSMLSKIGWLINILEVRRNLKSF